MTLGHSLSQRNSHWAHDQQALELSTAPPLLSKESLDTPNWIYPAFAGAVTAAGLAVSGTIWRHRKSIIPLLQRELSRIRAKAAQLKFRMATVKEHWEQVEEGNIAPA